MDHTTILARSANATFQVVAGEAILIRMDTGTYYSLNPVGTDFWELLDGQTTINQHAHAIATKYNAKSDAFISDLQTLAARPHTPADLQALADQYDVDTSLVSEFVPLLAGPDAAQHAAALADTYTVSPQLVAADLIELASKLLAEKLIEAA